MSQPTLRRQEIPLDDPDSSWMFRPSAEKPLVATSAALDQYSQETILDCLRILQSKADVSQGLDYLQVFDFENGSRLWFIEDNTGGAITALLPEDY